MSLEDLREALGITGDLQAQDLAFLLSQAGYRREAAEALTMPVGGGHARGRP